MILRVKLDVGNLAIAKSLRDKRAIDIPADVACVRPFRESARAVIPAREPAFIAITHRLSTVRHCDRIPVVDGGMIAEEGSYEELLAKGGLFAELVRRQQINKG